MPARPENRAGLVFQTSNERSKRGTLLKRSGAIASLVLENCVKRLEMRRRSRKFRLRRLVRRGWIWLSRGVFIGAVIAIVCASMGRLRRRQNILGGVQAHPTRAFPSFS